MMKLFKTMGLALVALPAIQVIAAPQGGPPPPLPQENLFYLRVNAPKEPWHNRHLVRLPSSQTLGLENFTVHPTTPPVLFAPILLSQNKYALHVTYAGDDLSKSPYIAALTPKSGSRTVSMRVIFLPDPTDKAIELNPEACPKNYKCEADDWFASEGGPLGGLMGFAYSGYQGAWVPSKDAGSEGWHVNWQAQGDSGNGGFAHEIGIDVVPYEVSY